MTQIIWATGNSVKTSVTVKIIGMHWPDEATRQGSFLKKLWTRPLVVLTNNILLSKQFHSDVIVDNCDVFKTNYYENNFKIISSFDEKKQPTDLATALLKQS